MGAYGISGLRCPAWLRLGMQKPQWQTWTSGAAPRGRKNPGPPQPCGEPGKKGRISINYFLFRVYSYYGPIPKNYTHPINFLIYFLLPDSSCHPRSPVSSFIPPNPYNIIISVPVISTVLITTDMELTALASPTSEPRLPVNAGAADDMGLRASMVSACLYSIPKGSRK